MDIGRVLFQRAVITPDRTALIYNGRHFTYRYLDRRANRVANFLLSEGIRPGDRIAALLPNCNEFVEIYFACSRIGAIFVPLNIRLTAPELDYMIRDSQSRLFFYATAFEEKVDLMEYGRGIVHVVIGGAGGRGREYESQLERSSEKGLGLTIDDATTNVIMYTSGTTGFPKGATLTHGSMYSAGVDISISLPCRLSEKCLILAPFFHSGAISPLLCMFVRGVTSVIMDKFEPVAALRVMEQEQVTYMLGVTAIMKMLLDTEGLETFKLDSLKQVFLPGSPLPASLINESHDRLGVLCQNLWGLTELCGPGSVMPEEYVLVKPESAGKPYFSVDLRIVDDMGVDVTVGDIGEVIARGPNLMSGYWNQPEATARTIRDGWLYTGDLGYYDDEGFIYIVDRIKDMIISGGENIYPAEVEKVIRRIPGVAEAAVVGRPDEKWGESVVAFVVPTQNGSADESAIISYCRQELAGYKVPKQVHFMTELPRTPSGKTLKKDLRQIVSQSAGTHSDT